LNLFGAFRTKALAGASARQPLETQSDDPRPDDTLIALINQGEMEAFEALYRRHRDWAMHLACRIAGDQNLALDVLQEAFLYVLRKFPGFRLSCQFRSFLYPAVRNLAIAAREKAARSQAGDFIELDQLEAQPTAAGNNPSERAQLAEALKSLPEPQREVLLLRFVDGFSLEEIGTALEVPTGTVKSRLHHALAALRKDPRIRSYFE
jgi:RNA polymerase sigma-70 factor, ECF subfamily